MSEAGTAMSVDPASVAGDGGSGPLLSQAGSDESDATRGDYAGEAGAGGASSSAGGMTSSKGGASSGKGGAGAGGNSAGSGSAGAPFVGPVCAPTAALAAASELYLPCEVNSALYVCRTCHANPPLKPASTSYVTYADIKPRAAAIYDMVRTGYMPRPPYHLSEQQKVIVMTWLGLDGSCAVGVSSPCQ